MPRPVTITPPGLSSALYFLQDENLSIRSDTEGSIYNVGDTSSEISYEYSSFNYAITLVFTLR